MSMRDIRICRSCLMPSSRPRIVFDETGQCNACNYAEQKHEIDWAGRKREFLNTVDRFKRHPAYDVVVPFSGGKDSASIAWRMKHELGLRPLCVCYGQMLWTDEGRRNLHRCADAGLEILYWRVNQDVSRKLARRWLIERFHVKQHYDAAVNVVPLLTAINFGIPLVMFAEFGDGHFGGLVRNEDAWRRRDLAEVLEHSVGDDAINWQTDGITEADLYPYIYPKAADIARVGVEAHYWSWYFSWNVWDNADLMRDKIGFEPVLPRTDGSPEGRDSIDDKVDGIDFLGMRIKFGFGRTVRICSRLIQMGRMTRDEGLRLVHQYDHEFPERYLPEVLDYVSMTRPEFDALTDRHRNPEIWKREGDQWKLTFEYR